MNIRLKRLNAEYQKNLIIFAENPYIKIIKTIGNPPEEYQIEYSVKGLIHEKNNIQEINKHIVEIKIPRNYPIQQPVCKMLTPIFHPNIDNYTICIADPRQWTPSESLSSLIIRIGKIITYQSYNIKSPRNGEAAKWADKNKDKFPIDNANLNSLLYVDNATINSQEVEIQKHPKILTNEKLIDYSEGKINFKIKQSCNNCGKQENELITCISGHMVCSDCILVCEKCGKTICVLCDIKKCEKCGTITCKECTCKCH